MNYSIHLAFRLDIHTICKDYKLIWISLLLGDEVELHKYPATAEGFAQSWADRFPSSKVEVLLESLWQKDAKNFYAEPPVQLAAAC